jgi:hypothetical protein
MIDYLELSGYFSTISDTSVVICAFLAVIQPESSFNLYFAELGFFVLFIVFGILHFIAKRLDYKRKTEIIRRKREECNCYNTMATCDTDAYE